MIIGDLLGTPLGEFLGTLLRDLFGVLLGVLHRLGFSHHPANFPNQFIMDEEPRGKTTGYQKRLN